MKQVEEKKADRIEWIDAVKGIAIILIIFGHYVSEESMEWLFVYSFHVPLFIMVSGFFYKDTKFKTFLWKNVKGILVPYTLVLFLQYTLTIIIKGEPWLTTYQKCFYTILSGFGVAKIVPFPQADGVGVLWFLPMLFLVRMLFWILSAVSRGNEKVRMLLVLIAVMTGVWLGKLKWWLPWGADIALFAVIFYYAGFLLKQSGQIYVILKEKTVLFLCFIIWQIGIWRKINLEFVWRGYRGELTCIVVAIAGSLICCAVAYYLCRIEFMKRVLSWIGRGSLAILGIHQLEQRFVLVDNMGFGYGVFLVKGIVILCSYIFICVINWLWKTQVKKLTVGSGTAIIK